MTVVVPDDTPSPRDDSTRRPNAPRAILVAVGLLVSGFLATVLTGLPVGIAIGLLGYGLDSSAFVVGVFVANGVAFGAVGAVYLRRWLGGVPISFAGRDVRLVAVVTLVSLSFALAAELAFALFGGPAAGSLVTESIAADPMFFLGYAALSVFVIAPAEELLFRGAIQGRLRRTFGARGAVFGASLLFALPHALNFGGGYVTGAFAATVLFVVALLWGWAYERTGTLAVPILVHGLYNTGLATVSYLSHVGVV